VSLHQSPDNSSLLHDLLLKWEDCIRRGQPQEPRVLCRDCPELLEPLEAKIAILEALDRRFGMVQRETAEIAMDTVAEERPDILRAKRLVFQSEYELQRFHAQGGLGVVYIARDRSFQRDVAIKFTRRRWHSPTDLARFRREAEITGRLEHPGIVPVYAVNPPGRDDPCYVMRWIDGETLQDAIDQLHAPVNGSPIDFQSVPFRALLQQFISVCKTTSFAHNRGVIHRDIKPRNIMLGAYGETLLLDWGLAKWIAGTGPQDNLLPSEPAAGSEGEMTGPGDILGTLAYASPEQLSGQFEVVDQRSDIFSLGGVLYALLTGSAPYESAPLPSTKEIVTRGDVIRPRMRNSQIPRLLEAICMHALCIEPAGRYATAREIADDVERYLADEPVRVTSESVSERAMRWLRKHRTTAVTTAATLLVILLSVSFGTVLLSGKNRELAHLNQNVREQLEESQVNLQLAVSAVDQFCTNVSEDLRLQEADLNPLRSKLLNSAITFHEDLLHRRGTSTTAQLDLARSYSRLAALAREIDATSRAIEWYRDSIEAYRACLPDRSPDHAILLELIRDLADLGQLLAEAGQSSSASESIMESLSLARGLCSVESPSLQDAQALTRSLLNAAYVSKSTGNLDQAEDLLKEAVVHAAAFWKSPSDSIDMGWQLVESYLSLGDAYLLKGLKYWRPADESFVKARDIGLELLKQSTGSVHNKLDVAKAHYQLGIVHKIIGQPDKARSELRAAMSIQQSVYQQHPSLARCADRLADSYRQLGRVEELDGQDAAAEQAYQIGEQTLRRLIELYPGNQLRGSIHADLLQLLAEIHRARGSLETALNYANQAVGELEEIVKQSPTFKNAQTILPLALSVRASVLTDLGKYAEALLDWDQTLTVNSAAHFVPWYRIRRGRCLAHVGRHAEATSAVEESLPEILKHCEGQSAVEILLLAARIEAQSSITVRQDSALTSSERERKSEEYLLRAADHLRQAREAGMTSTDGEELRDTDEYEPLRKILDEGGTP
jgi:eukaryotic-like serine/threonine-protein kinase